MKFNNFFVCLIVCLFLSSCATSSNNDSEKPTQSIWDKANNYASQGQHKEAWEVLSNTPPALTEKTQEFLAIHPEVYLAGKNEFSIESLQTRQAKNFQITYIYTTLDNFSLYSNKKDQKWAENNVLKIYGKRPHSFMNSSNQVGRKSTNSKYGRVAGVQIIDRSHINTGAGAALGSVAGQAVYLDNTSWRNYSAINQLGVGLVGAMIGSAMDTPTSIAYERKYWITLNDGDTISISTTGIDNAHIPQGVCVIVYDSSSIEPANESNCKKKH